MSVESTFEQYRPLLFSIAYRMLGSAMEAEDMVQETYVRYLSATEEIHAPKAYLSAIITRLCIDHLKSARVQREQYVGPWLPEPMLTDSDPDTLESSTPESALRRVEDISLAFLVLLESLSPVERAVFLLREVFDYDYDEIARFVDKSEANCRQLYRRARQHIDEGKPRYSAPKEKQRDLIMRFMATVTTGDMGQLTSLLAEDVSLWSDGGGRIAAATRPLSGAQVIARFMIGISSKAPEDTVYRFSEINGSMAALVFVGEQLRVVVTLESDGQRIHNLRLIGNPDKLRYLLRQMGSEAP